MLMYINLMLFLWACIIFYFSSLFNLLNEQVELPMDE